MTQATTMTAGQSSIVPEFYYIDLPDVGVDTEGREQLVSSAFFTFADKQLDEAFGKRLSNSGGVVMARVGEWGNGIDSNMLYVLTLAQLRQKIDHLLKPQHTTILAETQAMRVYGFSDYATGDVGEIIKKAVTLGTNQQTLIDFRVITNEFNVINVIDDQHSWKDVIKNHAMWSKMASIVSWVFNEQDKKKQLNSVILNLTTDGMQEPITINRVDLVAHQHYVATDEHIKDVALAQRAVARIAHDLLGDAQNEGFIKTELIPSWNALKAENGVLWTGGPRNPFPPDDAVRQAAFINGLPKFLKAYFQVMKCIEICDDAMYVINSARVELSRVVRAVEIEQNRFSQTQVPKEYTVCADLDEAFGASVTWLRLIYDELSGDVATALQSTNSGFRKTVEKGANGLTEAGLVHVLGLRQGVSYAQIVTEINGKVGTNGAVWWQGMPQPRTWGEDILNWFDFRVFPKIPDSVRLSLQNEQGGWVEKNGGSTPPEYNYGVRSTALGLKVYAVQCATPDITKFDEDQIPQLIGNTIDMLQRNYVTYQKTPPDPRLYVRSQCSRSHGLPIRVPHQLGGAPLGKPIWDVVKSLSDYFVIIDN